MPCSRGTEHRLACNTLPLKRMHHPMCTSQEFNLFTR